ncbi:hypothetical protein I302_109123 [Kwoniella bestiolae CBS 10118]|uniref:DUF3824 domain-containing protein n=1 Tax=Kwoniella bestiolae CBS 10118 TaxID=1296100 RepID=A0A1B9FV34_9TREE|nr:hypothetical protein I302_08269 [Kwoniella bestiolae CBS 10118]OCF22618.1 hypothetical protein I302_08269 [Kwoniella bestiolae CBS 10118]
MALLLVSAGVKAGVRAYKAYDKKQKQKKEQKENEDTPDIGRLELNDPSCPSTSSSNGRTIPQGYTDEKKSREYDDTKNSNENPFEAPPPSYQNAIEASSSNNERYTGGFGPSEYTPQRRGSSSGSSSSSSSDDENSNKKGLTKSEYRDLRRRDRYERRLAKRQLRAQRRADRALHRGGGIPIGMAVSGGPLGRGGLVGGPGPVGRGGFGGRGRAIGW